MVDVLSGGRGPGDELALQYSRARYFDLKHGRFLQRDPKGYIDGSNLYEAFGSNPTRFVDPTGHWIADRIAEIMDEKGQLTVGDITTLADELHSAASKQIAQLTENELALLRALGGVRYGTPWTETTLSEDLKAKADKEFGALALPYRYRAEARYATRRRILYMLLFQKREFSAYVTDLYRLFERVAAADITFCDRRGDRRRGLHGDI